MGSELSRTELARFLPNHEAIVAWEQMHGAIGASADAQTAAEAAAADAAAAQAAADAAQGTPFIVAVPAPAAPQARTLAVDPKALTSTDGGAGNALTIGSADLIAILGGDVSESAGTLADATGLALALLANATYLVDGLLTFQAAAVTTGIALAFTLPAGASISGRYQHNTTAAASEGSYNIGSGLVKGNTSGVLVANENVPLTGRWIITTGGAAGNAQLQFRTEVAASAVTLKAALSALVARRIA